MNIHEMLVDRNYAVDPRNANITIHQFRDRFGQHPNRKQMTLIYEKKKNASSSRQSLIGKRKRDGEKNVASSSTHKEEEEEVEEVEKVEKEDEEDDEGPIVVMFATDTKVKVGAIRDELVPLMLENDAQNAILIVQTGITASANTALKQLSPTLRIQIFLEQEMLCMSAIIHHELQPKFTVLTKKEKTAVLTRYKSKESQLPRMLQTDPIARYYGLKRGHVVKIVRASETAGRYTLYRQVVASDLKLPKMTK